MVLLLKEQVYYILAVRICGIMWDQPKLEQFQQKKLVWRDIWIPCSEMFRTGPRSPHRFRDYDHLYSKIIEKSALIYILFMWKG